MGYKRVTSKELQSKLFELQFRHGNIDTLAKAFGLAYYIISEILGTEWTDSNLYLLGAPRKTYFKSRRQTDLEKHQNQGRIMQFADYLFTLQEMHGFKFKIAEILELDKGQLEQLEDLATELQIAKMIFNCNKNASFIKRIKNTPTPDIEIPLVEKSIFIEIKSRREDMPTTKNWIWDRLGEASSQIKNSIISQKAPGGIFLRVGPYLKNSSNANADVKTLVNEFFSNNSHLNFIQLVWENWIVNSNNSGGYIIKFKQFDNPKPLHPIVGTDTIIKEVGSISISYDGTYLPYSYLQAIKNNLKLF